MTRIPIGNRDTMTEEELAKLDKMPSIPELKFAKQFLISDAQQKYYREDYETLKNGGIIEESSSLIKFNPQIQDELIIMRSRLNNATTLPEQVRNPVILPKDAKISNLIILEQHQITAHAGPEVTLRNTRLKYWIVGGKRSVRKAIKLCEHNLCKYPKLVYAGQQIANLPTPRITPGNFFAASVDFAGPFTIKR